MPVEIANCAKLILTILLFQQHPITAQASKQFFHTVTQPKTIPNTRQQFLWHLGYTPPTHSLTEHQMHTDAQSPVRSGLKIKHEILEASFPCVAGTSKASPDAKSESQPRRRAWWHLGVFKLRKARRNEIDGARHSTSTN